MTTSMDRGNFNAVSNMWIRYSTLNMVQSLKRDRPEIRQEKKYDIDYFSRNMNYKYLIACFK